jgi:hypothetical protein
MFFGGVGPVKTITHDLRERGDLFAALFVFCKIDIASPLVTRHPTEQA